MSRSCSVYKISKKNNEQNVHTLKFISFIYRCCALVFKYLYLKFNLKKTLCHNSFFLISGVCFCHHSDGSGSTDASTARSDSPAPSTPSTSQEETAKPPDPELEKRLLGYLSDLSLSLPADSLTITNELTTVSL